MNILAINISHDESISRLNDGILVEYTENFSQDFYLKTFWQNSSMDLYISPKILNVKPDIVIYSSFGREGEVINYSDGFGEEYANDNDKLIIDAIQKQIGNPKFFFFRNHHHLYHAFNSFKLSPFDETLSIVLDGGGSQKILNFREVESIYYFSKNNYRCFYQRLTSFGRQKNDFIYNILDGVSKNKNDKQFFKKILNEDVDFEINDEPSSGNKFSRFINQKFMTDELRETLFFSTNRSNQDRSKIIKKYIEIMMTLNSWGNESGDKIEDHIKKLHVETKNDTIKFIEKALNYQYSNNIVLSGGFSANSFNREEYIKYFSNHNLFFDPVPHDGGTSSGAAFWLDYMINTLNYSYEDLKKLPYCYTNI